MADQILVYGANGYTGRLIVERAVADGLAPIVAGRNGSEIRSLADRHGLVPRIASLDDPAFVDVMLEDVDCVVNSAGPFTDTYAPLLDACIRTGTHYVDITGEIDVFEGVAARHADLRAAGIAALPGAGFDVVPSDCLAAHVADRVPGARELTLFIAARGAPSQGTTKTSLQSIAEPSRVRRNGVIRQLDGDPRRTFETDERSVDGLVLSWGDVATAHHSTGIPDITVMFPSDPRLARLVAAPEPVRNVLASSPARWVMSRLVERAPSGPSAERRARSSSTVIAEATNGTTARAKLTTPNGYELTARTAVEIGRRVAAGQVAPGFSTPSQAFGPDFILEFDGCERVDLD